VLVSQEVSSFFALLLRVYKYERRAGKRLRLPFETESTTNGREQFGCSLKRQPRSRQPSGRQTKCPRASVLFSFNGYSTAFNMA
jgi:hypothetical protein